jgi:hypothetical protein
LFGGGSAVDLRPGPRAGAAATVFSKLHARLFVAGGWDALVPSGRLLRGFV